MEFFSVGTRDISSEKIKSKVSLDEILSGVDGLKTISVMNEYALWVMNY